MRTAILLMSALALAGCDDKHADRPNDSAKAADAPNDNTKKNERDRGNETLTPGDQGSSEADRGITQKIRQGVVKTDALSMTAKNVKIITVDGVVTLRGPVKSDEEKTEIGKIGARRRRREARGQNQLEIAAK